MRVQSHFQLERQMFANFPNDYPTNKCDCDLIRKFAYPEKKTSFQFKYKRDISSFPTLLSSIFGLSRDLYSTTMGWNIQQAKIFFINFFSSLLFSPLFFFNISFVVEECGCNPRVSCGIRLRV